MQTVIETNLYYTIYKNFYISGDDSSGSMACITKRKSSLSVIKDHFSRSSFWWPKDIKINTTEGSKLFSITSPNGFPELVNEPSYIETRSSSCIDLIFTDQANLSENSAVHTPLQLNCHGL